MYLGREAFILGHPLSRMLRQVIHYASMLTLTYFKGRVLQIVFLFVAMCSTSLQPSDTPSVTPLRTTTAPDFSLQDLDGTEHQLSQYAGNYVVLEWVHFKCKAVDRLYRSGSIPEVQAQYTEKGVIWLSIGAPATGRQGALPAEQLRRLLEKRGSNHTAFLMDPGGRVGQMYGVQIVPFVVLISPEGDILYEGPLDNMPDSATADNDEYVNYIDQAFTQHGNAEPISVQRAEPYGCEVKYSF